MYQLASITVAPSLSQAVNGGNLTLGRILSAAIIGYQDILRLFIRGGAMCCQDQLFGELAALHKYFQSPFRRQGFYLGLNRASHIKAHLEEGAKTKTICLTVSFFKNKGKELLVQQEFSINENEQFTLTSFNEEGIS
jgi:hypothetical protein